MEEKYVKITLWFDFKSEQHFFKSWLFQRLIGSAIEMRECIQWAHEEVEGLEL